MNRSLLLVPAIAATLQLAAQAPPAAHGGPTIAIWTEADEYFPGDSAIFRLSMRNDAYLLVLQSDAEGRVRVLFPAHPGDADFVPAGAGSAAFLVGGSRGGAMIYAAVSRFPFDLNELRLGHEWDRDARLDVKTDGDFELAFTALMTRMSTGPYEYDVFRYDVIGPPAYAWLSGGALPNLSPAIVTTTGDGGSIDPSLPAWYSFDGTRQTNWSGFSCQAAPYSWNPQCYRGYCLSEGLIEPACLSGYNAYFVGFLQYGILPPWANGGCGAAIRCIWTGVTSSRPGVVTPGLGPPREHAAAASAERVVGARPLGASAPHRPAEATRSKPSPGVGASGGRSAPHEPSTPAAHPSSTTKHRNPPSSPGRPPTD